MSNGTKNCPFTVGERVNEKEVDPVNGVVPPMLPLSIFRLVELRSPVSVIEENSSSELKPREEVVASTSLSVPSWLKPRGACARSV